MWPSSCVCLYDHADCYLLAVVFDPRFKLEYFADKAENAMNTGLINKQENVA